MKKKTYLAVLTLISLLLTACSGVMDSASPAKQYYMLVPYSGSGSGAPPAGPKLAITISAVPGLDTDRVQAFSSDARLNHYANARWPDHLPEVLTSVMKRSLAASGRFSSVEEGSRAKDGGWFLALEVQQFYGIQNSAGTTSNVRVEMNGTVECNGQVSSFTVSDSNPVSEERLSAVIAAHQRGLDNVTQQLLEQVNQSCI